MPYPSQIDAQNLGCDALKIVEARGWAAWSMRDVASELDVTVNAIYRYVDNREDLVVAVGEAAAHALAAHLGKAKQQGEARLIELAHRYIKFSVNRPHAFAAFVHAKPPSDDPRIAAWFGVLNQVHEVMAALLPEATSAATFTCWAFLRGRAELARGPRQPISPTAGLDDAVRALVAGFRALGTVPSPFPAKKNNR
jgi:AcrR family transcriptional regulator